MYAMLLLQHLFENFLLRVARSFLGARAERRPAFIPCARSKIQTKEKNKMIKLIAVGLVAVAGLLAVIGINSGSGKKAAYCMICLQNKPPCCQTVAQVDKSELTALWKF